ncbi:hypothetical protein AGOR_G00111170 [Albula goreensis]|uniref:Uncharacterized protein n=1 Tax=Albula goreensis TaxID=1534307 RepID=A0A8T3DIC4_9TELE|nr:hypothetical protein AGOR_G00111170 [Albula goreensis]
MGPGRKGGDEFEYWNAAVVLQLNILAIGILPVDHPLSRAMAVALSSRIVGCGLGFRLGSQGRLLNSKYQFTTRQGVLTRGMTTSTGSGYQQANIVILHKSLADDFETFCRANSGPLPLLYRSQPGEWSCPPLAEDSDIRTDCPQYCVFEDGRLTKQVPDLMGFGRQMQDMVSFYLGCSYGFERTLQSAGVPIRNVEQKRNVSMYRTALPCHKVGVFQGPMVVSMRPIPAEKLDAAVLASNQFPMAHGGPIHIGDPAMIGIRDLSQPEYGDTVDPALETSQCSGPVE